MAEKSKLTPVMQQYVDFKAENPDVRALEEYDELYDAIMEAM